MRKRNRFRTVALFLVGAGAGWAQVEQIRPLRVVDLLAVIERDRGRTDFSARRVTQANGRWAVLMESRTGESAIVRGDRNSERVSIVAGRFDQIALDAGHRLYLRQFRREGHTTGISVFGWEADTPDTYEIPAVRAFPFASDGRVLWKTSEAPAGFLSGDPAGTKDLRWNPIPQRLESQAAAALPARPMHSVDIHMGLPGQRCAVLNTSTEAISLLGPGGELQTTAPADLDAAYSAIGRVVPKEVQPGPERVIWAAAAPDGLVYVSFSGLPVAGPACLAVINPENGRVVKTLTVLLPTSAKARDVDNPEGTILPTFGAADDQLALLDNGLGILVLYERL